MDITKFCANNDEPRHYMANPVQLDECVVATNGHICIFDTDPIVKGSVGEAPVTTIELMNRLYLECLKAENWSLHTPIDLPEKLECTYCKGTGELTKKECPECNGHCYVDLCNEYSDYTIECDTCDGKGTIKATEKPLPVCDACNGEKTVWDDRITFMVGGVRLSPGYYALFRDLPDLQMAIKDQHMIYFKSGKYIGALMAMRQ